VPYYFVACCFVNSRLKRFLIAKRYVKYFSISKNYIFLTATTKPVIFTKGMLFSPETEGGSPKAVMELQLSLSN